MWVICIFGMEGYWVVLGGEIREIQRYKQGRATINTNKDIKVFKANLV